MDCRFDRYVQNLDISDNILVSLDKTSLRDMGVVSLVQLNASRNDISYIHEEAFLGQSRLRAVDLSSNKLTSIESWTFMRNPFLERLSLSNNQLFRLPEEDPFLYSVSLRVLYLSACNISHIPPKTFQNLPKLQELYISHNKIEILSPLQSVGRLTILDISHNYLTDLQSDIFTASPKLVHLDLSDNRFSTLNVTVMPHLANIHNTINLKGNPWECNCVMFDTVYSWCRKNSVELGLVCSSPPKFKNKPWIFYENAGCNDDDDDDDDDSIDFADLVENIANVNNDLPRSSHGKYIDQTVSDPLLRGTKEHHMISNLHYFYISIALCVVLFCLLTTAVVLLCRFMSHQLRRTGPASCDAEVCSLSSSNTLIES